MTTKKPQAIPMPHIHSTYAGGTVMGVMAGQNGAPDYLLIDLGIEPAKDVSWDEAVAWAATVGGDLPTLREMAVMFGNRGESQYQKRWYWSSEQHSADPAWAWIQTFSLGGQSTSRKVTRLRARAVRRVPKEEA